MQTFTLLATVLAALTAGAMADNCTPGLSYCGSTLLGKGHYTGQIAAAGKAGDTGNQLFSCLGGPEGAIEFISQCTSCVNGGQGQNDACAPGSKRSSAHF